MKLFKVFTSFQTGSGQTICCLFTEVLHVPHILPIVALTSHMCEMAGCRKLAAAVFCLLLACIYLFDKFLFVCLCVSAAAVLLEEGTGLLDVALDRFQLSDLRLAHLIQTPVQGVDTGVEDVQIL